MPAPPTIHTPVLAAEAIDWLDPQPGQVILDGTLGGGGHTRLLAGKVSDRGRVIALDRDAAALARAEESLSGLPVMIAQSNFCDAAEVLQEVGIAKVDGILLDLGLSSDQLADDERGFGFDSEGPLDLRFDTEQGEPAWHLLAHTREQDLANVIYEFGEERCSRRIAKEIVARRKTEPVTSARQLAELVRRCTPRPKSPQRIHPATRTFQALRIAVNEELKSLELALKRLPNLLAPGGRLVIISFHSLEDRRVKEAFRDDDRLTVLTRKPITPTEAETSTNPRSRSAKLRVAQRMSEVTRHDQSYNREGEAPADPQRNARRMAPLERRPPSEQVRRLSKQQHRPALVISGGQTGVDRAALDTAIALGIPHGGCCPAGRKAEDGPIPDRYQLTETESPEYHVRTEKNVIDSDGTLILYRDELSGGTKLTHRLAVKHGRPFLLADLSHAHAPDDVLSWLQENRIRRLNIAGPRESSVPGIGIQTRAFLQRLWCNTDEVQ